MVEGKSEKKGRETLENGGRKIWKEVEEKRNFRETRKETLKMRKETLD